MTPRGATAADALPADALLAARLLALDPRLGGIALRGGGTRRDAMVAALAAALPAHAPIRRLPVDIDDDRLMGGLDLGFALAGRGARLRPGLLGEADGGLLVAPLAERLSAATAARLGAALDAGEVRIERDGATLAAPARFVLAALDDAVEGETLPAALAERLAFHLDLDVPDVDASSPANEPLTDDAAIEALAATARALGIDSARASLFALRAARAAARLDGRDALTEADLRAAVRLVLAPRATQAPPPPENAAPPPPEHLPDESDDGATGTLEERVLDAVRAVLPADLLAALAGGGGERGHGRRGRGVRTRRSPTRGRPAGTRAGIPRDGRRLALAETLRAAAPWQTLRGRADRILVRAADLRVRRFEPRPQAVTILAVDASGSAAMARLAEAKGAVELLLGQAYVARAEVALIAFRGIGAELLLPPTRSLARARRALADLPGGGGTPLAAGLAAARDVAAAARARGRTPQLVLLSDGRGNIAADGTAGRIAAERDAIAAARAIAADGLAAIFIDTSARARPEAPRLAEAMRARYLALPYAGAAAIGAAVAALGARG